LPQPVVKDLTGLNLSVPNRSQAVINSAISSGELVLADEGAGEFGNGELLFVDEGTGALASTMRRCASIWSHVLYADPATNNPITR
jgi:hypothetical protein